MLDLAETVENKIENLRREVHKLDAKIAPMQILRPKKGQNETFAR